MAAIRSILMVCLFCWGSLKAETATDGDELLLIAVRSSLIPELIHRPLFQREAISENLKKPYSTGHAEMKGTFTANAADSFEAIALNLVLDSTTFIRTTNTTDGAKDPNDPNAKPGKSHPEIGVQFGSTIQTTAKTSKTLYIKESGFSLSDATTQVKSDLLGTQGLKVQAQGILPGRRIEFAEGDVRPHRVTDPSQKLPIPGSGLFPRLKARFGPKPANNSIREEKPNVEQKASATIADKINKNFNDMTWNELLPIHYRYYSYVYEPLVLKDFMGGRIGFGSNNGWLALRGSKGNQAYFTDVSRIPNLPVNWDESVVVRIHSELLERLAELRLGGTRMTEVEAAEMLGRAQTDEETLKNILGEGEQEILFIYDEQKPIKIQFTDNKIIMLLRFSEVSTLGKTLKGIQIRRTLAIKQSPEGLFIESQGPEAAETYDGKKIPGAIGEHITERFANSFAREKQNLRDKVIFSSVKSLAIKSINTIDNRIYVGLAPSLDNGVRK